MNNINIFTSRKGSASGSSVENVNGFNTNENSNKLNGDDTMNNIKILTSRKGSASGSSVENVNGFNTNENSNKLNGDETMKKDIKILTKKQFKALSKSQSYKEYESVGDLANCLKIKADEALEFFKAAKQDALKAEANFAEASIMLDNVETRLGECESELAETGSKLAATESELAETGSKLAETGSKLAATESELAETGSKLAATESELAETESELAETKVKLDESEIRLAEAQGQIDAGFELTTEIQNDLDNLIEERDEGMETYNRLDARMAGKKARANINMGTIRHYNNIIRQCKKDIENGKDVESNKAIILELQAEIRNIQRQVEAANGTFDEMKHNKTVVSQKIVKMDEELNKRYKLHNLLGELGYL